MNTMKIRADALSHLSRAQTQLTIASHSSTPELLHQQILAALIQLEQVASAILPDEDATYQPETSAALLEHYQKARDLHA